MKNHKNEELTFNEARKAMMKKGWLMKCGDYGDTFFYDKKMKVIKFTDKQNKQHFAACFDGIFDNAWRQAE